MQLELLNDEEEMLLIGNKEALLAIEELKGLYFNDIGLSGESITLAIDALEKQVSKKPIIKPWNAASCPCCGVHLSESLGDGYYKHWTSLKICECGQKLDWD